MQLIDDEALDHATFAACMTALEPFEDHPFLAIAVSGGPDSLALTLHADHWAKRRDGRVVGLTVDHGLRSSSADEARKTGQWLHDHGIEHHILTWLARDDEKPSSGLQQRAREARYALLADWCRRHHCLHLLTAHHREDQAETVAMRKARQSGAAGLAAMASVREIRGLRLLRPLLDIPKARLARSLKAKAQPWIDDPTNDDPLFTRNRFRQAGLDVDVLAGEAAQYGVRRRDADRRAAAALARHVKLDPAGFATLDAVGFERLDDRLALDILTRLLMTVGGRLYPPRRRSLLRLFQEMSEATPSPSSSGASRTFEPGTLAYCRILRRGDCWLFCREQLPSTSVALMPGQRQRWDDRFAAKLAASRRDLTVDALGDRARMADNTLISKKNSRHIPAAVKPTLPAIFADSALIAIPHLGLHDMSFDPDCLELRFCPRTPLANAPFMPHISTS